MWTTNAQTRCVTNMCFDQCLSLNLWPKAPRLSLEDLERRVEWMRNDSNWFFILDRAIESTAEVEWFIWFLPQKVININCFFSSLFLTLQSANVSYHGTSVWKQHDKLHFSADLMLYIEHYADSRFPVFAPENKESLLSNALKIHNLSLHWKMGS